MTFKYIFGRDVALGEVEATLHLACYACEGLFGAARVRLEVGYHIDETTRVCFLDASSPVGESVAQVFTGLVCREFGEDSFEVQSVWDAVAPRFCERAEPVGATR